MNSAIPFYDFGGSGPILHFAHPNAYPPACFRQMMAPLTEHYHVSGICHRPLWPGSRPEEMQSWDLIASDLQDFFAQQGYEGVIGVGHSLGAVATMMAAVRQPHLFRALVLIEPVFLPRPWLEVLRKEPGRAEENPMVSRARQRRNRWSSRQEAFEHFRGKKVFRRWPDQTLWDYVHFGLEDTAAGDVKLVYSREWEAHFYARPPVTVWEELPLLSQPTLAVRGAESDTLYPEAWTLWQTLQPGATFVEMEDAGHMVPMEQPEHLAALIRRFLHSLNAP